MKKENKRPYDENVYPHGLWEAYYNNGKLCYKGCYIHGEEYGYWEEYFANDLSPIKGNFIHGKMHGYWKDGYYHMGTRVYQTANNKILI